MPLPWQREIIRQTLIHPAATADVQSLFAPTPHRLCMSTAPRPLSALRPSHHFFL
ncbi:MAG: hypothetical protein LBS59_08350 [Puniceicoccales bacterium]|nr:hypothetical protein [Puniceicoccales bacterium]